MRNIPTKVDGTSTLSAAEFNDLADELETSITSTGQTLSSSDLAQVGKAMATYAAVGDFYTDSGVADAYVLTATGSFKPVFAYTNGVRVRFRPGNTNTGASTVNVATLGVKSIKKADGSTDPTAGDITAARDIELIYDGTNFRIYTPSVASASTQVEMEAASVTSSFVTPGRMQYHPGVAKALVNFDGTSTGTLRIAHNVSSITDNGVGDYTVNFTTAFSSTSYVGHVTAGKTTAGFSTQTPAPANAAPGTSTFRFGIGDSNGGAVDWTHVMCTFFGDQ